MKKRILKTGMVCVMCMMLAACGKADNNAEPTVAPTVEPTVAPTVEPTVEPTVAPTEAPESEDFVLDSDQQSIVDYVFNAVNELRASLGLNTLTKTTTLSNVAMYRAKHMADNNYFSHYYNGEKHYRVVATEYGYNSKSFIGENIFRCRGYSVAEVPVVAMETLIASQGHYDNMTNEMWTTMGVGAYYSEDDRRWYVVQIFGVE